MTPSLIAFLVLIGAFAWGSFTKVNAGLIALVAAFVVGTTLAGLPIADVIGAFPSGLFFILVGATLLFAIVRVNGTIDLMAYWCERLAGDRRLLVPILMFLLTAVLASAGAFTPAAIAIVAPVALALGARFGISALAMGLVVVQGANAGAFSPVNPFGVLSNQMLDSAGASGDSWKLYLYCFLFNALLAALAYFLIQGIVNRRAAKRDGAPGDGASAASAGTGNDGAPGVDDAGSSGGAGGTLTATRSVAEPITRVEVTPMRVITLLALVALLVLTTVFAIDVGVASLAIALVLIAINSGVQKPAVESMPWSAIILVTGIVTYVGMLEAMGALDELQAGIESLGNGSIAALVTGYVVALVSAFASTTGTLGVISPVVVPIAMDPLLTPIGVVTAISISSSVVDVSPMSTSGALLMASAQPKDERMFFRALLLWAIAMIGIVPIAVWFLFVQLGIG